MRQIDWYLDEARERQGLASDHELAKAIPISRGLVSQWRTRRTWPSGRVMKRLAEMAGADPDIAVAELGAWREPDVDAWKSIIDRLSRTAAAIVAAWFIWPSGTPAHASERAMNIAPPTAQKLYIMRQLLSAIRAWMCRQIGPFLTMPTQRSRVEMA